MSGCELLALSYPWLPHNKDHHRQFALETTKHIHWMKEKTPSSVQVKLLKAIIFNQDVTQCALGSLESKHVTAFGYMN